MTNTVLGVWDFFWIGLIVAVFGGGGATYINKSSSPKTDDQVAALERRVTELTEEVRKLKGGT